MTTVFISGSRQLAFFPEEACARIDKMIGAQLDIVIGDSPRGADSKAAHYLKSKGYPNVTVFTVRDKPRIGTQLDNWSICKIEPREAKKLSKDGSVRNQRDLETEKDHKMGAVADYGLVIWQSSFINRFGKESTSKGSLRNMYQLLHEGKPVVLYSYNTNTADFDCIELRNIADLERVVENEPEIVRKAYGGIKKQAEHETRKAKQPALIDAFNDNDVATLISVNSWEGSCDHGE
ncbi:hypothetical protein [Adlercreutzia sp. ZJ138]|uniref:hypothetical protein n=1 Tax=Adlercreutzia sp. ZJ138 TaxID=2709405 RepID=UPI0013EC350D|nr:hypothetical protein [Adlercreutzia sp. ZJ138]